MIFRFHLETTATPDQVFRAFTDFSDRRLEVWKKSLDRRKYEVRERGATSAVVREGSAGTKIWVLLRYDWEPGFVRWSLVDSDHCAAGRGEVRISPRDGAGSRVDVLIDHSRPRGVRGTVILLAQRVLGPVLFPRMWKSTLDRFAADQQQLS
ncbi:SRPBCC family protein [Modestobacter excelsi]|uniref:SRPBCC family protein n=1 Tax=Modestobacter excelsi TaxID=2213161 RepID=UPI00110D118B|nr:SRPBCC family protein [Modestobacter excelsi]